MTFESAKRKLAKVSKGKYRALRYTVTISDVKGYTAPEAKCGLYIHGANWVTESTWVEAFKALDAAMHPRRKKADRREQPGAADQV